MRVLRSLLHFTGMSVLPAALAFSAAPAQVSVAATAQPPPVYIAGHDIHTPAFVDRGRMLVPVRGVFEAIGASVEFTPPRFVVVRKDDAVIDAFILDRRRAIVGRDAIDLDVAPLRRDGKVYVPLRVVAESAGASVTYSNSPPAVFIVPAPVGLAAAPPVSADSDLGPPVRASSTLQWRIGVAVFSAICALGCVVLTARRFAPTLFHPPTPRERTAAPPDDHERPEPSDEIAAPPVPPPDLVGLTSEEATGEALISKRIVTEMQTINVPITREELVIEYGGDGGTVRFDGRELAAGETIRILLWEERVRVDVTKHVLLAHDLVLDKRRTGPMPNGERAAHDFAVAEGSPS